MGPAKTREEEQDLNANELKKPNVDEMNESLKGALDIIGEFTEIMLNALSVFCIIAGLVIALVRSLQMRMHSGRLHPMHTYFRLMFGGWLVVALELQLAADIVGTIISPTTRQLIELGAVALIRTFLNYFLGKELLEERELSKPDFETTEAKNSNQKVIA